MGMRNRSLAILVFSLTVCPVADGLLVPETVYSREVVKKEPYRIGSALLGAICMVESGCTDLVGDDGSAIGPMQIHRAYFEDAAEYDTSLGSDYQLCHDKAFSERVVIAYMARYMKPDATDREVAMVHNAGAGIHKKKGSKAYANAERYWEKVKKFLA